jgi:hypothetical protein
MTDVCNRISFSSLYLLSLTLFSLSLFSLSSLCTRIIYCDATQDFVKGSVRVGEYFCGCLDITHTHNILCTILIEPTNQIMQMTTVPAGLTQRPDQRRNHTTTKREGLYRKYYQYCKKFADMMKKEGTEATLDEWEKLYGSTATLKKSKMKTDPDRPTTIYSTGTTRCLN